MGVIVRPMQQIYVQKRKGGGQNVYFVCQYESGVPELQANSPEAKRTQAGNRYNPLWVARQDFAALKLHADYQPLTPIIKSIFDNKA